MSMRTAARLTCLALAVVSVVAPTAVSAADGPQLAAGSRIYLSLEEKVTSARGGDDVGTIVRCRIWRDVESGGVTFIKAETPATCRVDKVSRNNMGGFEGKISVAAVETRSIDDQNLLLSGGYNKEGSGHKAIVWTAGLLLFWPALFVPGGNATLPPGTVFDAYTVNDLRLKPTEAPPAPATVDLRAVSGALTAEFMLDDFVKQPKHETLRIKVTKADKLPDSLVIDSVNGKAISPIPLKIGQAETTDGASSAVAEVGAKDLVKYFARGINRFDVSFTDNGQRQSAEVVMNVQM